MTHMEFAQFKTTYDLRLDPQQETAVQTVEGPVLLLAVPGSGKTTVLVTRLGYMRHVCQIPPEQILTMTYTVAAARDMRQRYAAFFGEAESQELEFRTINGVCARIIRLYERTLNRKAFALLEDGRQKTALLADLCRTQTNEFVSESLIKAVETAITYAKNQMLTTEELTGVKVEGVTFPTLFQAYCKTLRERQLMDYDDQMVYALQILRQYPRILAMVQSRYRYFCVDEAQDTSKIQHAIIRLLAGESRNLFMVGDEDQSIYGFRAAYPQALTEFDQVYPNAKVLLMEQNYRSTEQIVEAADRFIQKNQNRHPKHMKATQGSGPQLRELSVHDRLKQYRYLCQVARDCDRETAVLYRDNDSALPLIDLLDREGIPYRCRQVDSVFFSSRTVRDLTDIIRFAQDPMDGERFLNIYYKMKAGISKAAAREAVTYAEREGKTLLGYISELSSVSPWTRKQCRTLEQYLESLLREPADQAVDCIIHCMGYGEYLEEREMDASKLDILQALGAAQPDVQHLLDRLEELQQVVQAGSTAGRECPFVLSTIHSSKGLEYERVILMDVADGLFPKVELPPQPSEEEWEAWEEERRLFYVGMTRAKRELALFTFRKTGLESRFGEELFPKVRTKVTPVPKPAPGDWRPAIPQVDQRQIEAVAKEYIPGTRLSHKKFGAGILTARNGDIITVSFTDGGMKTLSLSTALRGKQLELE